MAPKTKYQEGDKILCYHGPVLYEAKVLKISVKPKEVLYLVHYSGWNKSWDEWVDDERIVKHNEQGLQKQKELQILHSKSKRKSLGKGAAAKTASPSVASDTKSSSTKGDKDTPSRSSTPSIDKPAAKHKLAADTPTDAPTRRKKAKVQEPPPPPEPVEELYAPKVEVHIKLPDSLKPLLVDDWDRINRQKMLIQIPAGKNINTILDQYYQAKVSKDRESQDTVLEITKGIRDYFNTMLGTQLLYKFERTQYGEILKEQKNKEMTALYGSVHLLRLFIKIGNMLAYTALNEKSMSVLISHIQDFLRWMEKNASDLFPPSDYYCATAEYHRKALM